MITVPCIDQNLLVIQFADMSRDKQTNTQMDLKQYAPIIPSMGHKNTPKANELLELKDGLVMGHDL